MNIYAVDDRLIYVPCYLSVDDTVCLFLTPQTQIQYLKQVQQPSAAQLRSSMVDPAINLFFLKMKAELEQTKDKLEQAQNELSAWKFTPDR